MMFVGFSYFDRNVLLVVIYSFFDKYDIKWDGKFDEKEMKFFFEEIMGMDLY